MSNLTKTVAIVFVSVLGSLSFVNIAQADDPKFYVEGEVYCDNCKAQFVTRLSVPMPGAKVRLGCRKRDDWKVSYSVAGETNATGMYRIPIEGDHEEEICEMRLVQSSMPNCTETVGGWTKARSRVVLTSHNGMADSVRRANPLGFMTSKPLPECIQVYKEMGMLPPDFQGN